jgi:hypothetical protein
MKRFALMMVLVAPLAGGCDDDDKPADLGNTPDMTANTMNPAAPALGAQIDRMGRPGINTALTDPFDISSYNLGPFMNKTKDGLQDSYNANAAQSSWAGTHVPQIQFNLAVLDSLDDVCGNQAAASAAMADAGTRYAPLAGALSDDEVYVNTASATCTQYLAVEATALLGAPLGSDCGGRTPKMDVIDVTYSALAIGALTGVTDGVSDDSPNTRNTAFPFLSAPN